MNYYRSASDITIRVGDHDFENPTEALIEFDVELIVIHENYDETDSLENDIAVIKVCTMCFTYGGKLDIEYDSSPRGGQENLVSSENELEMHFVLIPLVMYLLPDE